MNEMIESILHSDARVRARREVASSRAMAPKKPSHASDGKKSAKAQLKEQREQIKHQLGAIETAAGSDGASRTIDNLFDAALGLDLWLVENKKSFPADAVRQKCERLGEIMKQATSGTLNAEEAYWELAGLYIIVHREASKEELKLSKPVFVLPNRLLPALPADDLLSAADVAEALGVDELTEQALTAKILELEAERARAKET